jgi:hypothetical protein
MLVLLMGGILKYADEMGSGGMINILSFINIDSGIQNTNTRTTNDLINLILFFQNKWPKIRTWLVENEEIRNLV